MDMEEKLGLEPPSKFTSWVTLVRTFNPLKNAGSLGYKIDGIE